MEHAGGVDLLESSCFGPDLTVSVDESVDVVAQLLGNGLFSTDTSSHEPIELESLTSMYWPDGDGAGSNHGHGWGRGACTGGGGGSTTAGHVVLLPSLELEGHDQYLNVVGPDDDDVDAMRDVAGFLVDVVEDERCDATKEVLVDDHACYVDETSNGSSGSVVNYLHMTSSFTSSLDHKHPPKRRLAVLELQKENDSHGSPQKKKKKKKVQKNGRRIKNEESRSDQNKNRKVFKQEEENDSSGSEEEACQSQDTNEEGGGVSSGGPKTGKSRAGRGSATDPQSIYARKRRERINERLKILQTLVPNGTKVDISTMLEEAVQYVKFLQLQIKLLSSDDLWMYAPIAYNGMSIGLDLKISPSH